MNYAMQWIMQCNELRNAIKYKKQWLFNYAFMQFFNNEIWKNWLKPLYKYLNMWMIQLCNQTIMQIIQLCIYKILQMIKICSYANIPIMQSYHHVFIQLCE